MSPSAILIHSDLFVFDSIIFFSSHLDFNPRMRNPPFLGLRGQDHIKIVSSGIICRDNRFLRAKVQVHVNSEESDSRNCGVEIDSKLILYLGFSIESNWYLSGHKFDQMCDKYSGRVNAF